MVLLNRYGYSIMLISPKRVIPEMANPISSSFALIAGATAAMADAPQIEVPTPISMASLLLIPIFCPRIRLARNENVMITSAFIAPIPT